MNWLLLAGALLGFGMIALIVALAMVVQHETKPSLPVHVSTDEEMAVARERIVRAQDAERERRAE